MHCLDFRRRLLTDPGDRDPELVCHRHECTHCAKWAGAEARFALRLQQATKVEIPDGLAERILLRHAFRRPPIRRRPLAVAASLLLGFIAAGALWSLHSQRVLAKDVFSHIDETSYALGSETILDDLIVANVFHWIGAEVVNELGHATFANLCMFRARRVAHLVLKRNDAGPVTLLIMPRESVQGRSQIEEGRLRGILVPFRGGALAIVGEQAERLDVLEARLRNGIVWRDRTAG